MEKSQNRFWSTEKRRDTIRLASIATFNGLLTIFTGIQAFGSADDVFITDGPLLVETSHDAGDTAVTSARAIALQKSTHEKPWFRKFRKATYISVSSLAIVATARSGWELLETAKEVIDSGLSWNDFEENIDRVVNGIVISTGNEASYLVSQTLEGKNEIVHDAKHHAKVDRDTSFILAAGIAAGAVVPFVAEVTGIGTGLYTGWHMRPTEKNLYHHSHLHDAH